MERVEFKDVRLPVQLQRAMATEAEAAREARAKVIAAEGEQRAAKAIKGAADIIAQSPCAIQLRYLQTLSNIATEKNSTIIFPVPVELLRVFGRMGGTPVSPPPSSSQMPTSNQSPSQTGINTNTNATNPSINNLKSSLSNKSVDLD